ncbi:MAG: hypothetical protein EOP88_13330 [Verrucomicrobiaceae bacterium]|nr:MAG: hypothetical protein EOP88_13330 [Verrucomicrobiaceae bacterium]
MQKRIDKINELQAKIDEINKRNREKFEFKREEARGAGDKPIVNPIRDIAATELAMKEAAKSAFSDPLAFSNNYARRGLSLGGPSQTDSKVDKQITLLSEIRDSMKRIADKNGPLTWVKP